MFKTSGSVPFLSSDTELSFTRISCVTVVCYRLMWVRLNMISPTACEWLGTKDSTQTYVVPRDKHELYLTIIPKLNDTEVDITVNFRDGKKNQRYKPKYATGMHSYQRTLQHLNEEVTDSTHLF